MVPKSKDSGETECTKCGTDFFKTTINTCVPKAVIGCKTYTEIAGYAIQCDECEDKFTYDNTNKVCLFGGSDCKANSLVYSSGNSMVKFGCECSGDAKILYGGYGCQKSSESQIQGCVENS